MFVDEFQDTDFHQKSIFEKLRKISDTFTIVGDIDQSIYGWNGAFPEYFDCAYIYNMQCGICQNMQYVHN